MIAWLRRVPANRWLEPALMAVVASGLIYALWHMWQYGYLPQPFFYEPFDLWGDWFNVVYWAYDPGTYDTWGALYPPLTFVFLKTFSLSRCYPIGAGAVNASAGLPARSCDWLGLGASHLIYLGTIVLVARSFIKNDRGTAPWRSYALCAGFPMLEALERNNLIITAFACIVLAYGPLVRSARLRWFFAALAINFKVYLIAAAVPQLLRRRWRWVEGVLIFTLGVYIATYAVLGRGTPFEIYKNIVSFSNNSVSQVLDLWFTATYLPLQGLLENWQSPIAGLIGSRWVNFLLILIPALMHSAQAIIIFASVAIWIRPEAVTRYRITNLGVSLALITTESGGYTPIIIIFFTFLERWKGFGRKWAIIACYILCIPLDIPLDKLPPIVRDTFFPNHTVIINYYIMLSPFLRPLILLTIPVALSCVTLRDVWEDIQKQGWKSRWRYRRDYPIMVGEGEARAPTP